MVDAKREAATRKVRRRVSHITGWTQNSLCYHECAC